MVESSSSLQSSLQPPLSPEGICSFCCLPFCVTKAGLLRIHGPIDSRCLGSGKLPAQCLSTGPCNDLKSSLPQQQPALSHCETFSSPFSNSNSFRVLKRVPRESRDLAARKFASIIDEVVLLNNHTSWSRLLKFAFHCFRQPSRGGKRWKLAKLVNKQIREDTDFLENPPKYKKTGKKRDPLESLAARVAGKLEEADFKGAVRLACSDDTIAAHSIDTLDALRDETPRATS